MILTIIELVFISILTALTVRFYLEYRNIKAIVIQFFEHKEGEQSAFGVAVQNLAKMIGDQAVIQAKTTLMGKNSALAREEKAIENAVLQDQNPALMALLETMPSVRKLLAKNPSLIGLATNMLSRLSGDNHQLSSSSIQPKFKL